MFLYTLFLSCALIKTKLWIHHNTCLHLEIDLITLIQVSVCCHFQEKQSEIVFWNFCKSYVLIFPFKNNLRKMVAFSSLDLFNAE